MVFQTQLTEPSICQIDLHFPAITAMESLFAATFNGVLQHYRHDSEVTVGAADSVCGGEPDNTSINSDVYG